MNHSSTAKVGGQQKCAAFPLDTETVFIDETIQQLFEHLENGVMGIG
jgi:hypothetical protein